MATSERKINANRQNAQKSTGPKSEAGKAVSRRNALKHGLKAIVVGLNEDSAAVEAERTAWISTLGPRNAIALRMADVSFRNYRRFIHVCDADDAAIAERVRKVSHEWKREGFERRKAAIQQIAEDPYRHYITLIETVEGCERILNVCRHLLGRLDRDEWGATDLELMFHFQGSRSEDGDVKLKLWTADLVELADVRVRLADDDLLCVRPPTLGEAEIAVWNVEIADFRAELLADQAAMKDRAEAARAGLRQRIMEHAEYMEELIDRRIDENSQTYQNALRAARFDPSDEARLRRRYLGEAHRDLEKSLKTAEAACGRTVAEEEDAEEETSPNEATEASAEFEDCAEESERVAGQIHPEQSIRLIPPSV